MKPLLDSSDYLDNPAELRSRARRDGYLLIRKLLPESAVENVGTGLSAYYG